MPRNYDRVEDGMSVEPEDAANAEDVAADWNYLADDGTVRCRICDRRVEPDGRCRNCDDIEDEGWEDDDDA